MATEKNELKFDFEAFASLSDDEIDTSDISPADALQDPKIGRFSDITFRNYDVRAIANWCILKARRDAHRVTKLWTNKIVSLIYEHSLVENHVLLTPARMEAWDFGPVFRELYYNAPSEEYSLYERFNVAIRKREVAVDPFDNEDLQLFNEVWERFGRLSGSQLTTITHAPNTPWSKVWNDGGSVNPGMQIDVALILDLAVELDDDTQ